LFIIKNKRRVIWSNLSCK